MVYGASGAIRHALACGTPCIASDCHHFDDVQGVIPRAGTYLELAEEIDKVFSDEVYRKDIVKRGLEFVHANNWDATAEKHIQVFQQIINNQQDAVKIEHYETI